MSVQLRLLAFAAVLVVAFATAALAGSAIDVHPGKPSATAKTDAHGSSAMAEKGAHGATAPRPSAASPSATAA